MSHISIVTLDKETHLNPFDSPWIKSADIVLMVDNENKTFDVVKHRWSALSKDNPLILINGYIYFWLTTS